MYIDRYDVNGNSIANMLYHMTDNDMIELQATIVADGTKRLDQYAYEYYGEGLNWWIIAAASGIGWWFNLTKREGNGDNVKKGVILKIPNLEEVVNLKNGEFQV